MPPCMDINHTQINHGESIKYGLLGDRPKESGNKSLHTQPAATTEPHQNYTRRSIINPFRGSTNI